MLPEIGAVEAMSTTPLLLRAQSVRVTAHPCLGLHEATTVSAALAIAVKQGTGLASAISLLSDLG